MLESYILWRPCGEAALLVTKLPVENVSTYTTNSLVRLAWGLEFPDDEDYNGYVVEMVFTASNFEVK